MLKNLDVSCTQRGASEGFKTEEQHDKIFIKKCHSGMDRENKLERERTK